MGTIPLGGAVDTQHGIIYLTWIDMIYLYRYTCLGNHWLVFVYTVDLQSLCMTGSTLVMRAITLDDAKAVRKAVSVTSRGERASQLLNVPRSSGKRLKRADNGVPWCPEVGKHLWIFYILNDWRILWCAILPRRHIIRVPLDWTWQDHEKGTLKILEPSRSLLALTPSLPSYGPLKMLPWWLQMPFSRPFASTFVFAILDNFQSALWLRFDFSRRGWYNMLQLWDWLHVSLCWGDACHIFGV